MTTPTTPLDRAREAFGSYREVARILGRDIAAVLRYKCASRNRAAGHFQPDQVPILLREAAKRGAPLTLHDLIPGADLSDAA